jgi:hypothetical protein
MTCPNKFINYNKSTTLVGDVDDGGRLDMHRDGRFMICKISLYLPLNLVVNPKIIFKKNEFWPGSIVHTYNPSYSGDRNKRIAAQANPGSDKN